ncbi:MAG: GNAT family N-acetyltransferase [Leptospirales bacterium]
MKATFSPLLNPPLSFPVGAPVSLRFVARFAETPDEIETVKCLRYDLFFRERNLEPDGVLQTDWDQFDPYCRHLVVIDSQNGMIVGTYRILTAEAARNTGGFYSETEFDLSSLEEIRATTVELGRAAIHPDYRGGFILALMWSAIFRFLSEGPWKSILGSASIDLSDGGQMARAVYHFLKQTAHDPQYCAIPYEPFPVGDPDIRELVTPPALFYGYLKLGACVMGPPAYDPVFQTADFPLLLCLDRMNRRFFRRFARKLSADTSWI